MSSRHGDALDMAEFKAIVTASFDEIGSNVALSNIRALHPTRLAPPSPEERTTRRSSPLSFLRKVKSHATSLLVSQSKPDSAPPSSHSHSFVPLLGPSRQATPAPFASRNLLTRTLGKHTHTPHVPDLEPKSFFFDDDEDEDKIDRRLTRCISTAPARPNPRISSAFAAAPILFGLSSPSASTPYLVPEKHDVRPESRADLVHISKSSLRLKLRTKLSLPKLASPRSNLSSPPSGPSPVIPSYHSHPYSTVFADFEPCRASLGDRSITPDEDPFRKDEMVPNLLVNPRHPSSTRSGSLDSDSETDKHILGSRTLPMFSSRWSFDSDSSPSSHNHTSVTGGRPCYFPSPSPNEHRASSIHLQSPSRSPLSLTFPLPPSSQKSVPLPGVTVRVSTSTPCPPPTYPPPRIPPPSGPLPCPPPAGTSITARTRPSARRQKGIPGRRSQADFGELAPTGHAQQGRSPLQMDQPLDQFLPRSKLAQLPIKERSDVTKRIKKSAPRRRDRPVTPFPLLLPAGQIEQITTGRPETSKAVTRVASPHEDPAFDRSADAIPDSETEPDRDFDCEKARKKTSVCSATSAQTTVSSLSTSSASTTASFVSVVSTMTAATTVSPSTSPQMNTIKPPHVSQVFVTDEQGRIASTATCNAPSSWPLSPAPVNPYASSPEISIEQGGVVHEASSDLSLVPGEQVVISASAWAEFRNYCDTCQDVSLCLAGNPYGNGVVDVQAVEIPHAGKTCGVEIRIVARTPNPRTSADFQGRIPGTYPLSSDPPSPLPVIPRILDIRKSKQKGSALGLDGVPPLNEVSHSTLTPGNSLDSANKGGQHGTALAFTVTLPTTLRGLLNRAGR